jgi:hypothetical protein
MGLISFLTGNVPIRTRFVDQDGKIDLMMVDATISETVNYESELTEYPVEDGPDVSDNVRLKPVSLEIQGLVSESPITLRGAAASLATSAAVAVAGRKGGFNTQLAGVAGGFIGASLLKETVNGADADGNTRALNPADVARKQLEDMWRRKQIFVIVTRRRKYDSMIITKLTFPKTQQDGFSLRFNMSVRQIRIVSPETVLIRNIATEKSHGGKKTQLGKQATEAANEQEKQTGSLLFQGFKKFSGG